MIVKVIERERPASFWACRRVVALAKKRCEAPRLSS